MTNMAELVRRLEKGAWLFDPQSNEQPLGFVTKNKGIDGQNTYLILWYYNSKTNTPVRVTYKFYDLVKYLQPSYAPYLCSRPIQWIPVYPNFVKEHYPKIFENHTTRNSIFHLPEQLLQRPDAKTIKALYHYILKEIPSLHNTYKTGEELLDMIVKKYEQESSQGKKANPCYCISHQA